jgi:hypothetical protein
VISQQVADELAREIRLVRAEYFVHRRDAVGEREIVTVGECEGLPEA